MPINPYISDILAQPTTLRDSIDQFDPSRTEELIARIKKGDFNKIVLTGMGSSHYAAYPAWLTMLSLTTPTISVNSAELLHYGREMIDGRTLLWINSQSGFSVEIVRLLELLKNRRPAFQLSMTNNSDSPVAHSADLVFPIHAGSEATVSTKTFTNMMATLMLVSAQLAGKDWKTLIISMQKAIDGMENYLAYWPKKVMELDALLGNIDQLLILGRGASMGAVWQGSLISKEAGKAAFEGMSVADFRHGPMELASPRLTLLIMQGAAKTSRLNHALAMEVVGCGGKVLWIGDQPNPHLPTLLIPEVEENVRPLVEILPLQMLTILMAQRNGLEPGKFRNITKVTTEE